MKVLLIRPKSSSIITSINIIDLEPLELEYLYTVGRQEGFNCKIYDGMHDVTSLKEVVADFMPDIVAISGYITQEKKMLDCARGVKKLNHQAKVIIGGVHAEVNYQRFYSQYVDFIVHSSSLEPFKSILHLIKGESIALNTIDGICYQQNGEWIVNQKLPINPNDLPIPDRSYFYQNKERYRYLSFSPCAIVKTAFSCPYQCSFCYCRKINDGKYAARDIQLVVEEIAGLDCEHIHIIDDTFLLDGRRIKEFISLVKERGIQKKFIFYSRADFIVENEDLIKELSLIGVVGIIVGLEAIDDSTLAAYDKQTSSDANQLCIRILRKYNIDCLALFIIGIDAVPEDFKRLYSWIREMNLIYATVSMFTPIPGTEQYEFYKDHLITSNIEDWDFLHLVIKPERMTVKAFYFQYYKLFVKLFALSRRAGIYDFIDLDYVHKRAKVYFRGLLQK